MKARHRILSMLVLLGASASAPCPASAQDLGLGVGLDVGAGTVLLVPAVVLVAEGIDKGTRGHGLHEGGAIFEIVWGVLFNAAAIPLYLVMSEHCYGTPAERSDPDWRRGCGGRYPNDVENDLVPLLG